MQGIIRDNTFGYYTAIIRYNMQVKMPTSRIIGIIPQHSQAKAEAGIQYEYEYEYSYEYEYQIYMGRKWDAYGIATISRELQICAVSREYEYEYIKPHV